MKPEDNTEPRERASNGFFLVAKRNGEIRAMMRVDGFACDEIAETLLEWHETDPERRLEIVTSLHAKDTTA